MIIRIFDTLVASLALVLLSPLLLAIALVLRFTGEREVMFLQERIGKDGVPFSVYKFATMLKDSPNLGTGVLTVKNDPRILPIGRFLRSTKLNEIPQLYNVVKGDMSLIGPRPQARQHFDVFPLDVQEDLKRVRPGLSGVGSIVFRDEENILERAVDKEAYYAEVIAPYKGKVEQWYIDRQSLGLNVVLILLTVLAIIFPKTTAYKHFLKSLPEPGNDLLNPQTRF